MVILNYNKGTVGNPSTEKEDTTKKLDIAGPEVDKYACFPFTMVIQWCLLWKWHDRNIWAYTFLVSYEDVIFAESLPDGSP